MRAFGGDLGEVGRGDAGLGDVALADAGALQDPLVGRVDQLLEVRVGQHPRRHVGGQAGDLHGAELPGRRDPADVVLHHKSVPLRGRQAEVFVGARGRDAAARRAFQEAGLDEKRLVDVFERVALLAERRRQAADADRTAAELVDDRAQQPPIDLVEAVLVHLEHRQRLLRDVDA